MKITSDLYSSSLALFTDFYQLTMANGYWKSGIAEKEAVFNLFFRKNPFNGGFTINCGLEYIIDYVKNFQFTEEDLSYLATINGREGKPLFEDDFLKYLGDLKLQVDIDAIPEGMAVFPHEPIVRVKGPILQCQLLESPLLNIINFQSLIATKAARIFNVAKGDPVMEFGLRRAHGIDGALAASRASYIGGCSSTSNVLAGKLFGIPVSGTHAHSWVMAFGDEPTAFKAYAEAMPDNCILLVDTYNTIEGIKHAIKVGEMLKKKGKKLSGIRIDSGDLAYFSIQARQMLDEAGFDETTIVASNDLDENIISSLRTQDAKIGIWGIGTKLVTAYDQPALGAVYKLSAIKNNKNKWEYKIKLSEQAIKVNNPGIQQVRRFYSGNEKGEKVPMADMLYDINTPLKEKLKIIDPMDLTRRKIIKTEGLNYDELLIPVFEKGKQVYQSPNIHKIRQQTIDSLNEIPSGVKRLVNPHSYPVGLEEKLYKLKTDLILKLRNLNDDDSE
ncbi:nicotinate phosphoribosyltransferase [Catalinimonas alkaloidigena]|uniref:nicotinate phosphoribosyltransferase n=1 Tax=Catalinimonas alkaloidigena TaxID=1075417 RepID=UPI002406B156|nr:nicotinate phosphoribosyltransferase [Catalinimonas alkaloidigena]MDF9796688.1 nicotinate phosphoribosyltransferase [Catalinimonas alkaloidigena]